MIVTVREDMTSNITTEDGLFECELLDYNPETFVKFGSQYEIEQFAKSILSNPNYFRPKLTDEQKQALKDKEASESNIRRAKAELINTDWSDLASVRNTQISPHLTNGSDFDSYRATLRAIIVNKTVIVETWPECPQAVWSTQ